MERLAVKINLYFFAFLNGIFVNIYFVAIVIILLRLADIFAIKKKLK